MLPRVSTQDHLGQTKSIDTDAVQRNNTPAVPPEERIRQLKKEIAELEAKLG